MDKQAVLQNCNTSTKKCHKSTIKNFKQFFDRTDGETKAGFPPNFATLIFVILILQADTITAFVMIKKILTIFLQYQLWRHC